LPTVGQEVDTTQESEAPMDDDSWQDGALWEGPDEADFKDTEKRVRTPRRLPVCRKEAARHSLGCLAWVCRSRTAPLRIMLTLLYSVHGTVAPMKVPTPRFGARVRV
jgi:hypothetical protein